MHDILRWETRLNAFENEMNTLNTLPAIIEKAKLWNEVQGTPSFMWNTSIWQATSFIDLSSRGITEQFEKEMTTPYKQMIQNEVHVNAQSDQSAQEMPSNSYDWYQRVFQDLGVDVNGDAEDDDPNGDGKERKMEIYVLHQLRHYQTAVIVCSIVAVICMLNLCAMFQKKKSAPIVKRASYADH